MTSHGLGIEYPVAFEKAIRQLSNSALYWLNNILESMVEKFEGPEEFKEFEPFKLLEDR